MPRYIPTIEHEDVASKDAIGAFVGYRYRSHSVFVELSTMEDDTVLVDLDVCMGTRRENIIVPMTQLLDALAFLQTQELA